MSGVEKPSQGNIDLFEQYRQQADHARIAKLELQIRQLKPNAVLVCIGIIVVTALVIYLSTIFPSLNHPLTIVLLSLLSVVAACFAFCQISRLDKRIDALYKLIKTSKY
ncbi:hypothetical protein [Thalassotalea ganghwensis]